MRHADAGPTLIASRCRPRQDVRQRKPIERPRLSPAQPRRRQPCSSHNGRSALAPLRVKSTKPVARSPTLNPSSSSSSSSSSPSPVSSYPPSLRPSLRRCRPGGHVRLRRASLERRRLPVGRSGTRPASPPSAHHPHHMPARLNRPSEERQAGPAEGQVQTAVVIAAPRRRSVSPDPFGRVG
jgi:hypothetical protein